MSTSIRFPLRICLNGATQNVIKKFTAAIITTALFFGLITGLIEAYASTGWLKGQWSSDLELVLPESPTERGISDHGKRR